MQFDKERKIKASMKKDFTKQNLPLKKKELTIQSQTVHQYPLQIQQTDLHSLKNFEAKKYAEKTRHFQTDWLVFQVANKLYARFLEVRHYHNSNYNPFPLRCIVRIGNLCKIKLIKRTNLQLEDLCIRNLFFEFILQRLSIKKTRKIFKNLSKRLKDPVKYYNKSKKLPPLTTRKSQPQSQRTSQSPNNKQISEFSSYKTQQNLQNYHFASNQKKIQSENQSPKKINRNLSDQKVDFENNQKKNKRNYQARQNQTQETNKNTQVKLCTCLNLKHSDQILQAFQQAQHELSFCSIPSENLLKAFQNFQSVIKNLDQLELFEKLKKLEITTMPNFLEQENPITDFYNQFYNKQNQKFQQQELFISIIACSDYSQEFSQQKVEMYWDGFFKISDQNDYGTSKEKIKTYIQTLVNVVFDYIPQLALNLKLVDQEQIENLKTKIWDKQALIQYFIKQTSDENQQPEINKISFKQFVQNQIEQFNFDWTSCFGIREILQKSQELNDEKYQFSKSLKTNLTRTKNTKKNVEKNQGQQSQNDGIEEANNLSAEFDILEDQSLNTEESTQK